ncbi:hypothetical protein O9K51_03689 [Purpureocillium lavendulum]|uniref:Uncharacterized protein n=1 Tax=Purpureocillium lavendulum TaxID=1247861 RepID=A0AB34FTS0_9HYPO|nr:hypothetical protein O9K51_03689 [Purpureocillium lavendulum]
MIRPVFGERKEEQVQVQPSYDDGKTQYARPMGGSDAQPPQNNYGAPPQAYQQQQQKQQPDSRKKKATKAGTAAGFLSTLAG